MLLAMNSVKNEEQGVAKAVNEFILPKIAYLSENQELIKSRASPKIGTFSHKVEKLHEQSVTRANSITIVIVRILENFILSSLELIGAPTDRRRETASTDRRNIGHTTDKPRTIECIVYLVYI